MAALLTLSLAVIAILASVAAAATNITEILSAFPEYSEFNDLLSKTKLADEINSREPVTVCALSSITGKYPLSVFKSVLFPDVPNHRKSNIIFRKSTWRKCCVNVTSAYGNSYHYSDHVTEGHFAFQAVEAGDYMACFFAYDHKPATTITIDFGWKSGVAAKDWTSVAKKGSIED